MARLVYLLLLPNLFAFVFSEPDHCYFPNGELAEAALSCWDANRGQTGLCCRPGDLCLDNSLCQSADDDSDYYRGACLDKMWSTEDCPKYCHEPNDQIALVRECSGVSIRAGTRWFCGDRCGAGDPIDLPEKANVYATAGVEPERSSVLTPDPVTDPPENQDPASTTIAPDAPQSSLGQPVDTTTEPASVQPSPGEPADTATEDDSIQPSSTSPPSEPLPQPTTSSAPLLISLPGPATTTAAVITVTPEATGSGSPESATPSTTPDAGSTQPTPTPSDTPQDDGKSSAAVPIGVGVAVGTSVLIAASVLLFFYQRKRRRQTPVRAETPPPFEFSFINNQAPDWLGPSYGPKLPAMHGTNKNTPELGGTARFELP